MKQQSADCGRTRSRETTMRSRQRQKRHYRNCRLRILTWQLKSVWISQSDEVSASIVEVSAVDTWLGDGRTLYHIVFSFLLVSSCFPFSPSPPSCPDHFRHPPSLLPPASCSFISPPFFSIYSFKAPTSSSFFFPQSQSRLPP